MAQVPMTDAQPLQVASAAHNNAIIDNVQDHEARLVPVETRTTDTATNGGHGNVRLSDRLGTGVGTGTNVTTGNAASQLADIRTRLGTGVTTASTATSQLNALDARLDTAEPKITTLETLTGHASHGNLALDTRVDTLEASGAVDLAGKIVARGRRDSSKGTSSGEVGVLRVDSVSLTTGRIYAISSSFSINETNPNSGGLMTARIRYNTSGAATTASPVLTSVFGLSESTGFIVFEGLRSPTVNETVSILLTIEKTGLGDRSMEAVGDPGNGRYIHLLVQDNGPDPTDTGVDIP